MFILLCAVRGVALEDGLIDAGCWSWTVSESELEIVYKYIGLVT